MTLSVLLSGQLLASVLVLASLYALVAIGLNLVYGTMRLLNVAHGELVMLGGYVAYWGFVRCGISPLLSALIAMALAALAGALIYIAVIRRLFRSARLLQRVEVELAAGVLRHLDHRAKRRRARLHGQQSRLSISRQCRRDRRCADRRQPARRAGDSRDRLFRLRPVLSLCPLRHGDARHHSAPRRRRAGRHRRRSDQRAGLRAGLCARRACRRADQHDAGDFALHGLSVHRLRISSSSFSAVSAISPEAFSAPWCWPLSRSTASR